MPSQSSRPHLPRVQVLVCLGRVNNILYLKKKILFQQYKVLWNRHPETKFNMFRKTPNVCLRYWNDQQEPCSAGILMGNTCREDAINNYRSVRVVKLLKKIFSRLDSEKPQKKINSWALQAETTCVGYIVDFQQRGPPFFGILL